jgi:uncharacterized protein
MNYALITGASKGIGKEMAYELARRKTNLVLVARSGDILQKIASELSSKFSVDIKTLALDLSQQNAAQQVFDFCTKNSLNINILINNAGYGLWGNFEKVSLEEQNNMMQLNMSLVVNLTHLFIPELKKNKPAYIMNVCSTAAYQAVAYLTVYAATKAFILFFTRGLRHELINEGISVTCLSPGSTDTGFVARARMNERLKKTADKFNMKPGQVAKIAIEGMFNKKAEILPGLTNLISVKAVGLMPKSLSERIAKKLYSPDK